MFHFSLYITFREEEACGVSSLRTAQYAMGGQTRPDRTPNIQQSAQISRTSESQSFSVTRDHINNTFPDNHEQIIATRGASTFCNPAAAPPFLSCTAVVGDFDYMDRHETIQEIDLSKKKLSPIEERSDENKRSSSSSADKSWMNYNGTSSVSTFRMHSEGGSEPEYDRVHHLEHINEADGHTVFEASICDKKGLCTVCQKHEGIAGALDTSLARFPSQLILSEIEEGVSTLAINTTAACTNSSSFEPKPVNPVKEIASMMKALDFEVYPNLYFDTEKELAQRFAVHCKITLGMFFYANTLKFLHAFPTSRYQLNLSNLLRDLRSTEGIHKGVLKREYTKCNHIFWLPRCACHTSFNILLSAL